MTDAKARYSSRKFIVVSVALSMSFGLAIFGKLTAEFAAIVSVVVGAYIGINGMVETAKVKAGE